MAPKPLAQRLYESVVIRAAVYYLLVFLILQVLPASLMISNGGVVTPAADFPPTGAAPGATIPLAGPALGLVVFTAMIAALIMSLPVAWVFTLTRQKRGYSQSVVQLLVALPPVVTGIVVLVQFSLALAFSLAGIVAAVRFRNTLDDSKDAVYAFVAMGIGICSAVDLYASFVLSLVASGVALLMWYTDFGRTPAHLEGAMAKKRLERVLANASRTGTFVARMDQELFEHMSPEQLEAAAARMLKRKSDGESATKVHILRFTTQAPEVMRAKVEGMLQDRVKQFSFVGTHPANGGGRRLEYTVSLKKKDSKESLLEEVKKSLPELEEVDVK